MSKLFPSFLLVLTVVLATIFVIDKPSTSAHTRHPWSPVRGAAMPRAVGDWDYVYYANSIPTNLPITDRWTFQRDPDQGKGSIKTEIINGQLKVTNAGKFEYRRTDADDPLIGGDSLTLEMRSYVAASPTCLDGPCLGHVFGNVYPLPGGATRSAISVHIWQTKLIVEDRNSNPDPEFSITPGYHKFRFAQTVSAGTIRLFVDDALLWAGTTSSGSASVVSPRISIHFERDTQSYVDYIAYTAGNFSPIDLASPPSPFRLPFVDTWPITQGPGCGNHIGKFQAEAIDFEMPSLTPVYAADDGTVNFAGKGKGETAGFGNYVRIDHLDGSRSYYAHLFDFAVAKGNLVLRGDPIGRSDNTGISTNPHLHFQVLDSSATPVSIRDLEGITWNDSANPCLGGTATGPSVP